MKNNQPITTPLLIEDLGLHLPTISSLKKHRFGIFKCHCGNMFKTRISSVKLGLTKSCGCLKIKHGLTKTKIHKIWEGMIQRTNNLNSKSYPNYGGRGIKICDEWRGDFMSFYNWAMDNGYEKGLTIDRIDNDGNYEPSNCRWANYFTQSANTRKIMSTNTSNFRGVSKHNQCNKWVAQIGIKKENKYLGIYNTALEAAFAYDNYITSNNLPHTSNFNTMT